MKQLPRVAFIFATYPLLVVAVSVPKDKFRVNSLHATEIKMCHFDCFLRNKSISICKACLYTEWHHFENIL